MANTTSYMFHKRIHRISVLFLLLITSQLCGCSVSRTMQTSTLFAMDTVMELQILGDEELLRDGEGIIRRIEKSLSVTSNSSDISELNEQGNVPLEEWECDLVKETLDICDSTDGALDITIYPVLKAWGFTTSEYRVPTKEELAGLLDNVDYHKVDLNYKGRNSNNNGTGDKTSGDSDIQKQFAGSCTIPEGAQVDLGSVAKGYTSRTLYEYFTEKGVTSGLINLGGNVQCIGSKPNGDAWNVAVKSPFKDSASGILGVLKASDEAVVTSGGYERYFEEDGKTYWHIIDPATGKPAENGLISVTIIGKDGLLCDGLSTALFVKGLDGAAEYYREHRAISTNTDTETESDKTFDMILVTEDSEVYVTEGISDRFSLSSEYYNLNVHVIN